VHAAGSGLWRDAFPGTELLFGVLLWGGAWLAGDRTRLRRERMDELEERARRAERDAERDRRLAAAEERTKIARDLHDSAGHAINVILVHAGLGRLRAREGSEATGEQFETIEQVARETVGEIDQLVGILRSSPSEDAGEGVEPPPGLAALDGLVERHRAAGMEVTVTRRDMDRSLPPAVDRGAYRILQEALTNAARHGTGTASADVAVGDDALELTVVNPVRREDRPSASGGHGLIGMRERATILGGTFDARRNGTEFSVRAQLPLTENGA
jgi:signal transduction histidine kinase